VKFWDLFSTARADYNLCIFIELYNAGIKSITYNFEASESKLVNCYVLMAYGWKTTFDSY
jgi:hypothetical protein